MPSPLEKAYHRLLDDTAVTETMRTALSRREDHAKSVRDQQFNKLRGQVLYGRDAAYGAALIRAREHSGLTEIEDDFANMRSIDETIKLYQGEVVAVESSGPEFTTRLSLGVLASDASLQARFTDSDDVELAIPLQAGTGVSIVGLIQKHVPAADYLGRAFKYRDVSTSLPKIEVPGSDQITIPSSQELGTLTIVAAEFNVEAIIDAQANAAPAVHSLLTSAYTLTKPT